MRASHDCFGFTSDWLRKWRESFFNQSLSVVMQNQSKRKLLSTQNRSNSRKPVFYYIKSDQSKEKIDYASLKKSAGKVTWTTRIEFGKALCHSDQSPHTKRNNQNSTKQSKLKKKKKKNLNLFPANQALEIMKMKLKAKSFHAADWLSAYDRFFNLLDGIYVGYRY